MKKLTKIFIAEDHPFYAKGVSNVLDNFSQFSVVGITELASEIIPNIKLVSPQILILDINLSGENSFDIVPEIKRLFPKLKILILSMYLPSDTKISSVKKDIDGYVLKNSGTEILVKALTNLSLNLKYWDPNINTENHHSKDNFVQKLKLSARELEILALLKEGLTNKQISDNLFLSEFTVKTHRKNIMSKMEVNNIVDLLKKSQ